MQTDRMRIGGATVFWRIAKSTSLAAVQEGLADLGLEDHCPEPRTEMACLKAALGEVYKPVDAKTERYIIRPYKNGITGFAVVSEPVDECKRAGDDYGKVVAVAGFDGESNALRIDPYDSYTESQIRTSMTGAAQWVTAAAVGKALSDLVESLGGVALRPSGGVYWLNEDCLDRWAHISDVFETASAHKDKDGAEQEPSHVYALKVIADEQMVRAVGDALTDEIERAVATIEEEVQSPDMTSRSCDHRVYRTARLMEKVKRYEQAFSKPLTALTDAVQRAAIAAATASLQASACSGAVTV